MLVTVICWRGVGLDLFAVTVSEFPCLALFPVFGCAACLDSRSSSSESSEYGVEVTLSAFVELTSHHRNQGFDERYLSAGLGEFLHSIEAYCK